MSRSQTVNRRIRSIGIIALALAATTVALPLLLLLAVFFDLIRLFTGRAQFTAIRLLVVGWVFLAAEVVGIIALGAVWVASGGGRLRRLLIGGTYAIQRWWAGTLFAVIRAVFALELEVEGDAMLTPGPIIVFMRHASIIDNLLPSVLITAPHGIKLRYVLKQELLSDPALDIAGNRLPNYFVDRHGGGATEVEAVGRLGMGLGADEGVLIYPEGTRFTPERRSRALDRLKGTPLLARAESLEEVLPPRPRGPIALLDVDPPADVIIAAHTGLDGFSHIRNILTGNLVGSTVRVRFERHPIESIPRDESARIDWLYDRWADVDRWIRE